MASWRQSINFISRLKVGGEWIYDQEQIRNLVEQYYIDLYIDPIPIRPTLVGVEFDCISKEMRSWLERPFQRKRFCMLSNLWRRTRLLGQMVFLKILQGVLGDSGKGCHGSV